MMKINVSIEQNSLERAYKLLKHINGAFEHAVAMATNRTLEGVRTDAVRETAGRYFAKSGDIRKTITVNKASAGKLTGTVVSRGGRRKLSQYQLTPKTPQAGRKKGFKGAVKRDSGLKPLPHGTFMMNTPNAGYVLFIRTNPGRGWQNIKHVVSPSIPQIVKNEETVKIVEMQARERFEKRLNHEVMRILTVLP
ncbi:MAG: phage tail protein [Synergistaceae bacterium]|nr:phage tail protein [Synergistaceae bacterium]MBQ9629104.1 phage tail protein [Synergistaceae bacterium]